MVDNADGGIVSLSSVCTLEVLPLMGRPDMDARVLSSTLPRSLFCLKKTCFCCSFTFGVAIRDEVLLKSQMIFMVSPGEKKTHY